MAAEQTTELKPAWSTSWRTQEEPVQAAGSTMLLGLIFCLAVLSVGVWLAKRFGLIKPPAKNGGLRLLERTPLSAKTSLCLVEARGKQYLLAIGSERVSLISPMSVDGVLTEEQSFEEYMLCEKPQPISAC